MTRSILISVGVLIVLSAATVVVAQESGRVAEDVPTVAGILERYVEAVGGREALEKLTTRVCTGKEITDLKSRQQPIYESHYFKAHSSIPMSYYTEEWTDAGNYCRGYDGKVGWIRDKCGVKLDESAGKRRLDWLLNPQNALRIEEYFPDLTLEGTQDVQGHAVYVLKSPQLHRPLFFDTTTGLLIGFGHNWEIHDYNEVDGVLFPHRVHLSRKGGSTVYEFERVEHNVEIDNSLFVMPTDSD
ncbi:MAG: hypothetical protein JSU65_06505 [Candidatus Zixiibacteriota bacterium]|nr:MAG: hypothetical protein JSU65_06505 [candidate division Zixibacteria bacterium]